MKRWIVEEIARRKLIAFIDDDFLYVGVRFSLSQRAQELKSLELSGAYIKGSGEFWQKFPRR